MNVALLLNNMGDAYCMQRKIDKELEVFYRALVTAQEKLGRVHMDTANTLLNIANVMSDEVKYEKARDHYGFPYMRIDTELAVWK